jgi:hypothetical protein
MVYVVFDWILVVALCGAADGGERGDEGANSSGPAKGAGAKQQVYRAADRQQVAAGVRK